MHLTKVEKIWLIAVVLFYVLYNLPFFPGYAHPKATILHGILTLVPLWISVYLGLHKVCKIYKLKNNKDGDES